LNASAASGFIKTSNPDSSTGGGVGMVCAMRVGAGVGGDVAITVGEGISVGASSATVGTIAMGMGTWEDYGWQATTKTSAIKTRTCMPRDDNNVIGVSPTLNNFDCVMVAFCPKLEYTGEKRIRKIVRDHYTNKISTFQIYAPACKGEAFLRSVHRAQKCFAPTAKIFRASGVTANARSIFIRFIRRARVQSRTARARTAAHGRTRRARSKLGTLFALRVVSRFSNRAQH
jgi:hypothetical protein